MIKKIAISSSLSWEHNWDPLYSIDLAIKKEFKFCQVFIGDNFKENKLASEVAKRSKDKVTIFAHSPVDLNRSALDNDLLITIDNLLQYEEKLVVYHHDYKYPIDETVSVIKKLNSRGITVLLENFYLDKPNVTEILESYKNILKESKKNCLDIIPLIDIPRLFIEGIVDKVDSLSETFKLFELISDLNIDMYLHLIDCNSSSQVRESWCPVGKGIIPYSSILNKIKKLKIDIPVAVLEFEELKHIGDSISYLMNNM